ncbi:deoxyguanosinetriphosphate triphosphohydrolase [Inquilinus sp.]|uniref:deoxyguanosinetriphosphate triphosphohydrolase n=1 Tax=Inquilinus sp. TaxID=1932117 RepID=UPI0031D9F33C
MTAVYATAPDRSRGRLHAEPDSGMRSPFQRDRDRIVHSSAFRKLQYKTQVFIYHEGDYYRTRLTHTLEVAQIARTICRALGLDEDLGEAVALAHDLGHTPFGHAGEDALHAAMAGHGGFHHNDQTLRILTALEQRYAGFDGLNLTWETLEGVVKHNGPLLPLPPGGRLPATIDAFRATWDLDLASQPGPEAQVAALADDIAYTNHDIDDAVRAGLLDVDVLRRLPLVGPVLAEVEAHHPGLPRRRLIHETVRRVIDQMVTDLLAESRRRLSELAPVSVEAIRAAPLPVIAFSDSVAADLAVVRGFMFREVYRHYLVNRETSKARRVVRDLFGLFTAEPNTLPTDWRRQADAAGPSGLPRLVADYIAGMTDRYALLEHQRLFALDRPI